MEVFRSNISIEDAFNLIKNNGKLYYSYPKIKNINRTLILYLKDCINIRNNINISNIYNLQNSGNMEINSSSKSDNKNNKDNDTNNKDNIISTN